MEWMWNAMWAWIGWNILAPLVVIVAFFITLFAASVPRMIRQARCNHLRLHTAGRAGTEQHCSECGKFVCHTWDLEKRKSAADLTAP